MCNNPIPQMLGIRAIAEMYCLPVHFVRALVNNGDVTAIRVGRKILVNADKFCEFLNSNRLKPSREENDDKTEANEIVRKSKTRISPIPARRGG